MAARNDQKATPNKKRSYRYIPWIILTGYVIAFIAAITYHIIWLRVMSVFLNSLLFSLVLILAGVSLGIALGSLSETKLLYKKKDMIDQAIEEYERAIALKSNFADAHYNLGIAFLKQGLINEAISEWKEVIRIKPNDINNRYNLAMAYYNHGDIEQSIALLEEVVRLKPDFPQAGSLLQMLYMTRQE